MVFRRKKYLGPVERVGADAFIIALSDDERAAFLRFFDEFETMLSSAGNNDPRLTRLFPTAYHDDPQRDAEYQRLMRDELLASKRHALQQARAMLATDSATQISGADLMAFLQILNNLRLVLGTMLDVVEDDHEMDADDPSAGQFGLYEYIGWLMEWVVATLAESSD